MTRKPYQDSDEWRQERRGGYGASDAPILVEGDEAAWRQLHGEKLGLLPDREPSETMELGKILEGVILKAGAEREGWKVQRVNRLVRHPEIPYVFASLDGRIRGGRPVEVKKWGFKSDAWGPPGSDTVPTSILYQLQQQAAVTGADAIEVLTLFGGAKLERFTVGRDESIIRELLELEVAAWAFVARGEMPPWPGEQPKRIVLSADEIPLDETLLAVVDEWEYWSEVTKESKDSLDDVKTRLRASLSDVGGAKGVDELGRRVSIAYRPTDPKPTVAWELVAKAYRKSIEDNVYKGHDYPLGPGDLDAIESMFTTETAPTRPLRITIGKNGKDTQ